MCIGARSVSFYFSKGITIFLKTMYTLLQFSLPVFTICTKILFLPYLYVVVRQVPGPFDSWYYSICKRLPKNVAMWVRQRCEKTTVCGVVYAYKDVRDSASTRLFVNLSTLYTFVCKLLNIIALKRVDKPALCAHYCLHAARIMIVVCTVCTM